VPNLTVDAPALDDFDLSIVQLILIQTFKEFIDSNQENDLACVKLRELYNAVYAEQSKRHPNDYPSGHDNFESYLARRGEREEIASSRVTGLRCIHCGSTNVRSYNKDEWKRRDCGRRFRKH
jgi:hypothetical protein